MPQIAPAAEILALPRFIVAITDMLRKSRSLGQIGVTAALILMLVGCRSQAYQDVYHQKMAGEIRVLEDQLYAADYENQVLRDEVSRAEMRAAQVMVPENTPRRSFLGKTLDESGAVIDVPKSNPRPKLPARALDTEKSPQTLEPPAMSERKTPQPSKAPNNRFTPPSEPAPPGTRDLLIPDVELGDPVPPLGPGAKPEALPGKIEIPKSAKKLGMGPPAQPVAIRINSNLSGGHKTDDKPAVEGVFLFIEAIDDKGSVVRLDQFDIDANLSVVLLDPSRSGDTARLGKWDFGPDEIRQMMLGGIIPGDLGSGISVVIPWGTDRPNAPSVIAHVRLSADEVVMQTKSEVPTALPTVAQWTPRAGVKR